MKKIIIATLSAVLFVVLVSSCGSNAECPAYSQVQQPVELVAMS